MQTAANLVILTAMAAPTWITEAGVIASFTVATVALFGERVRLRLFPPRLSVRRPNEVGYLETRTVPVTSGAPGQERRIEERHYRLEVTNQRRNSPAQDVRVVVEAIEAYRPNGTPFLIYRGPIPLRWQHAEAYPTHRTAGSSAVADFLVVAEDRTLRLQTMTVVPDVYAGIYSGHTKLRITVSARGREADSPQLRVVVTWDGQWDRGDTEMATHLTIDEEPRERSDGPDDPS